ncbi:MAG TPA: hypothetical protein VHF22_03390, partial [Planctomycetota bacterium]|nr:hypothetical protein [Planctomycetota bacterium]
MKLAVYRRTDLAAEGPDPEAVVTAMLRAMVRREPAVPVVAPIDGGAAGAWIEEGDVPERVLGSWTEGSFAFGDMHALRPDRAAGLLDVVRGRSGAGLEQLDGSFAALVHDALARRTTILTDRFGTRPLYVKQDLRAFACASEAKALFAIPGCEPREDPLAIYDLLNYGWIVGERTWFDGVSLVPDGTAIVLERGRPAERLRYRDRLFMPGRLSEGEGLEAVADAFKRGLQALGRIAPKPAILLSGGLDSRTIAAFAVRAGL